MFFSRNIRIILKRFHISNFQSQNCLILPKKAHRFKKISYIEFSIPKPPYFTEKKLIILKRFHISIILSKFILYFHKKCISRHASLIDLLHTRLYPIFLTLSLIHRYMPCKSWKVKKLAIILTVKTVGFLTHMGYNKSSS